APVQEPWDGPAAMVFTDGRSVGAKLDRNGLRPLRYTLTSSGLLVVGSEVGIADLHGEQVAERQRLGPGEMLTCDPTSGEFSRPRDNRQTSRFPRAPAPPRHSARHPHREDGARAHAGFSTGHGCAGLDGRPVQVAVSTARP